MKINELFVWFLLWTLGGGTFAADKALIRSCHSPFVAVVNGFKKLRYVNVPMNSHEIDHLLPNHLNAVPPKGSTALRVFQNRPMFEKFNDWTDSNHFEVPITGAQDLAQIWKLGKTSNVVLLDDLMISGQLGGGKINDLMNKHIALAKYAAQARFAGVFGLLPDSSAFLGNESGTFLTPPELLQPMAELLREELSISRIDLVPYVSREELSQRIQGLAADEYHLGEWRYYDPVGDEHLLRMMKFAKQVYQDAQEREKFSEGYHKRNEGRTGALDNPNFGKYTVGQVPPLDTKALVEVVLKGIKEISEYTPHFGALPQWSPYSRDYIGSKLPIVPSKLFIALILGRTRNYLPTGLEEKLEEKILNYPDRSVQIHELIGDAYRLAQGDLNRAFLTAENVLTKDRHLKTRDDSPILKKLAYIRNDSAPFGDNYGAWYHFFGMALYSFEKPWLLSRLVAEVETYYSRKLSPQDTQEELINRLGASFGALLTKKIREMERGKLLHSGSAPAYMRLNEFSGGNP